MSEVHTKDLKVAEGRFDEEKMAKLKQRIIDKRNELLKEINQSLANGYSSEYNYLKSLELQCSSELRLISHIENGMNDTFIIC